MSSRILFCILLLAAITLPQRLVAQSAAPDFGDDSSEWANDEQCDDPRFIGTGAASTMDNVDLMKDASDCRAAFAAGTVALKQSADAKTGAVTFELEFETEPDAGNIYEFVDVKLRDDRVNFVTDYGPDAARKDYGVELSLDGGEGCNSYRYGTSPEFMDKDDIVDETVCGSIGVSGDVYTIEVMRTTHASDATCTLFDNKNGDCSMVHIEATITQLGDECTAEGVVGQHLRKRGGLWENITLPVAGTCLLMEN